MPITIEIAQTICVEKDPSSSWEYHIDFPQSSSALQVYSLEIIGWVFCKTNPLTRVRVENAGHVLAEFKPSIDRPDVAQVFPGQAETQNCGFSEIVNLIGLQGNFEILIRAESADGTAIIIGRIRGNRLPLVPESASAIQPLMITTLGRTGSTWLTHMLGMHSRIVTYRPFQSEPRVSNYWAQVLLTLGNAKSYMQMLAADLSDDLWWLGVRPLPFSLSAADPEVLQEIGGTSTRDLALLCRNRIDSFYLQIARIQGKTGVRYFGEKLPPNLVPLVIRDLYPHPREIIVVRDFRDMLCSMIAYNAKLGFTGFGGADFTNQGDYVRKLRTDVLMLHSAWRSRRSQVHLVRYEDLVKNPKEVMAGIFHYLGVAHTEIDLAELVEKASRDFGESSSHRTSADSTQSVGRWRTELDAPLQAVCREAFGDFLTEFGYALE